MDIVENYLRFLYDLDSLVVKDIRGPNLPVEKDNKPNWIRYCMTLESSQLKINCLRRVREMTSINPFYQQRIDRFVDAITNTYEPTDKPGIFN